MLFVYRCGKMGVHPLLNERYFVTHTVVSEDAEVSDVDTLTALDPAVGMLFYPFGVGSLFSPPPYDLSLCHPVVECIWPKVKCLRPLNPTNTNHGPVLNTHAKEAAVRLQRVGADGSLGRIFLPILDDTWFTDPPHRRHIDASHWNSLLPSGLGGGPFTWTHTSRTYHLAIVHRKDLSWTQVTSYNVLPSVCRIWNRWRPYNNALYHAEDTKWVPEELA